MTTRFHALSRVVTGRGIVPRSSWLRRIVTMLDLRRTRIDLSRLDDAMLHDIGLTREDVEAELSRPVWDVPAHWRR